MQQHGHSEPVHFSHHPGAGRVGNIHDEVVFRHGGAQADFTGGEILGAPVVRIADLPQNIAVAQKIQHFFAAHGIAQGFAGLEGQFVCGTLEVVQQDIQVIRIQQSIFCRLIKEVFGMGHDELIQRIGGRHHERGGNAVATAGTAGLLPGAGDGAGIAAQNTGFQSADINAQLQGVGGDNGIDIAGAQAFFNFPPLVGQIAAPVAPHFAGIAKGVRHQGLQLPCHHLHLQAGLGKDDALYMVFQQHGGNGLSLGQDAFADAQLLVHYRRIIEDIVLFPGGGAVVIDQFHRPADEGFRQFFWILNGGRTEDEFGVAAVKFTKAQQPAQYIRQVAAEDTPVGMDFVNDDILQVFKQLHPFGVLGQDTGVEHIRVGYHHMAGLTHGTPGGRRGIAVVGEGFHIHLHQLDQFIKLAHLIGRQGLGGEQVQCPGIRIFQNGGQNRNVIAQGFAGCSGGDHHIIFSLSGCFQTGSLVGIQLVHTVLCKGLRQPGVNIPGPRGITGRTGRNGAPCGDIFHKKGIAFQPFQQLG